jgi:hypothetical protein
MDVYGCVWLNVFCLCVCVYACVCVCECVNVCVCVCVCCSLVVLVTAVACAHVHVRLPVQSSLVSDEYLQRLCRNFEALDPEVGFTQPVRLFRTLLTNKAWERAALRDIVAVLREIWERRQAEHRQENDFLQNLHELYEDLSEEERFRQVGVDVFILHVASLANLYAALAWTFLNLLSYPEHGYVEGKRERGVLCVGEYVCVCVCVCVCETRT